jgi:molecular chaperone GrpE
MREREQTVDHRDGSPGAGAPAEGRAERDPEREPGREREPQPAERDAAANAGSTPTAGERSRDREAADVEGDLDELVKTAAQRDEYLALAQRTQADFENYRKRVAREAAGAQERGAVTLAKELLPALDNLDRAIGAAAADDPLLEGVRLVREDLGAALARVGIEAYSPLGEPFDPSLHEAVATAPAPDGGPSGTVLEVYQAGYRIGDSVIRAARVVVAA